MSLLPFHPQEHDLYNARTIPDTRLIFDYKTTAGYQMLASFDELAQYDDRQTDGYLLYQQIQIYDILSLDEVSKSGNTSFRFSLLTDFGAGSLGWYVYFNESNKWDSNWIWVPANATRKSPMDFGDEVRISRHLAFIEHEVFL